MNDEKQYKERKLNSVEELQNIKAGSLAFDKKCYSVTIVAVTSIDVHLFYRDFDGKFCYIRKTADDFINEYVLLEEEKKGD